LTVDGNGGNGKGKGDDDDDDVLKLCPSTVDDST
jgi:hypothetical protein